MNEAFVRSDSRALQAGGRRFDPGHVHQILQEDLHWVVAEDHDHVRFNLGKCFGEPVKRLLAGRVARA